MREKIKNILESIYKDDGALWQEGYHSEDMDMALKYMGEKDTFRKLGVVIKHPNSGLEIIGYAEILFQDEHQYYYSLKLNEKEYSYLMKVLPIYQAKVNNKLEEKKKQRDQEVLDMLPNLV